MNRNATITRRSDCYDPWVWCLKIEYMEQHLFQRFIADLKITVDCSRRKYDPIKKRWLFHRESAEDVDHLLATHGIEYAFEDARSEGSERSQTTAITSRQEALTELYLLPNAPAFVINAVYRTLAKKYHPDAGGTTEQMQRLNAAVEVLR